MGLAALLATASASEAAVLRYDVIDSTLFASGPQSFLPPDQRTPVSGSLKGFFLYDTSRERAVSVFLSVDGTSSGLEATFDTIVTSSRERLIATSSLLGQDPGDELLRLEHRPNLPSGGASSSALVSLEGPLFGFFSYSSVNTIISSSPTNGIDSNPVFDITGTISPSTPTAVPLPPAGLALLAALGGFVALRRRVNSKGLGC
ncbi:MAG: hypothetical protein AAGH74_07060 [Pseudomonadota bacterium]